MRKKIHYYDIRHLLKDYPEAYYYLAIGERSNGKTYSALQYALENYFKTGEQFAYIRRYTEDVRPKHLNSLFNAHSENGEISRLSNGIFSSVDYTSRRFYPYSFDEDKQKRVLSDDPIGYAFDLAGMEHDKSISFPRVTTIIFDEFLSRMGYLPNEFILFMNSLSTIIRTRNNVKIFMLGNTVNKFCPYFAEMGLAHVKEQKAGTIDVYNYADTGLQVVVEYCDPLSKKGGKSSDVYFAFDNPQLKMITGGDWEIAVYPHLEYKYRTRDVIQHFFIEFDEAILHCELVVTKNNYFIFVHQKTTPIQDVDKDIVYSSTPHQLWNYKTSFIKERDALSAAIRQMYMENRIYFSTNEVGEIFRNYVKWSRSFISSEGL